MGNMTLGSFGKSYNCKGCGNIELHVFFILLGGMDYTICHETYNLIENLGLIWQVYYI